MKACDREPEIHSRLLSGQHSRAGPRLRFHRVQRCSTAFRGTRWPWQRNTQRTALLFLATASFERLVNFPGLVSRESTIARVSNGKVSLFRKRGETGVGGG